MRVLIVSGNQELAQIWARHLLRNGTDVEMAETSDHAIAAIREVIFPVIVMDVAIGDDVVSDICGYAAYRRPDCKLVLVSNSSFFSNCQIFNILPNTCAVMPAQVSPVELEAVVEYHGELSCA